MRRSLLAGGVVAAIAVVGLAVTQTGRAQGDPSSRAISFLSAHQLADGSMEESVGETEDAVMSTVGAGYDPAAIRSSSGASLVDFLDRQARVAGGTATADAGHTGKLILAVVASGRNAHSFAGLDLDAHLRTFYVPATGVFGNGATYAQALSILALRAMGETPDPTAVNRLRAMANPDGSWSSAGTPGIQGDTNSTSVALMALNSAGLTTANRTALAFLHSQQNADGGFPFEKPSSFGTASDPVSDAVVIQALAACGQNPLEGIWLTAGGNPVTHLLSTQDAATGGFLFPGHPEPDVFTTASAPMGVEMEPLPVRATIETGVGLAREAASARSALTFLASQQSSDGSIGGAAGPTEDFVMAMAAAGFDPSTTTTQGRSAFDFLATVVPPASSGGATAKLILAAQSGHRSVRSFAGHDLVAELVSSFDPSTGGYGAGTTFSQSLAILALTASGQPVPPGAIQHLLALQDADGGWSATAATPSRSALSDSNSTAMALMALAARDLHAADGPGIAYLGSTQQADGGFAFDVHSHSDPDSTALAIQALEATFHNPAGVPFSRGAADAFTYLLTIQDPASGGFGFGSAAPDAFTTSQVPLGLERVPFPPPATYVAGNGLKPGTTGGLGPGASSAKPTPTAVPTLSRIASSVRGAVPTPTPTAAPTATAKPSPTPSATPNGLVHGGVQGLSVMPPPSATPSPAGGRGGLPWYAFALAAVIAAAAVAGGARWFATRRA